MGNHVSQTPELSLSDSSTGRVRQGERGAAEHQGTAVLQGMCVHLETCRAHGGLQRTVLHIQNSCEPIDKAHS